jgi:Rrf2 family protein
MVSSHMRLVFRKGVLAIAAVIDVAVNAGSGPVSAKALAARQKLPPRRLEPVLQALVRDGILKGIRGPRGGCALARERRRISADDSLRAAGSAEEVSEPLYRSRCSSMTWCGRPWPKPNAVSRRRSSAPMLRPWRGGRKR